LVYFIIDKQMVLFAWLLGVSFLTDAVDGFLARMYKVTSVMGARIDSIADDLTLTAAIIGVIFFKPEFLKRELSLFLIPVVLYLFQMVFAIRKYGKISGFHTYGAKIASILQAVFLLMLFFFSQPVYWIFHLMVFVTSA